MEPTTYVAVRHLHVGLAALSVSVFAARGVALLLAHSWPRARWLRRATAAVDTGLLAAGATLAAASHTYPGESGWLTVKLALVVVYIALGVLALGRSRSPTARVALLCGALLTVAQIILIATTHDARGVLSLIDR